MRIVKTLARIALLLLCASVQATPTPQKMLSVMAQTEVVNAKAYGVVCDGVTDDYAAFVSALADVPTGGRLYLPPSGTTCLLSQNLVITKSMTVFANPGTVTLKAKTGNTSNPVLVNVNGVTGPVLIFGIAFDGGGTTFANTNNVVQEFGSTNVTFDHIVVQNTRGIGLLVSSSSQSGVRDSQFINIGMNWKNSLSGTDRYQAIAFCCTNTMTPKQNFAVNNYFNQIGLDAISFTSNQNYTIAGNRCDLGLTTAQFVTLAGQSQYPACIYVSSNTGGVIVNNVSDSAPGNAYDIGTSGGHSNLTITGNYATTSGGAGVAIAATNDFTIAGNVLINNGQNASDCHIGAISFANTNTIGTVVGNQATDTQGSPTQQYGVYSFTGCSNVATLTNVLIDQNNMLVGNKLAAYGGGLSNPTTWALSPTMTGNWTLTPASGNALTINAASASFGLLIFPNGSTDAQQVVASAGNQASIKLRGNGNSGAAAFQLNQDSSGNANLLQLANAPLNIGTNGTTRIIAAAAGNITVNAPTSGTALTVTGVSGQLAVVPTQPVGTPTFTVAGLPACNAILKGGLAYVTDAAATPVYNASVTGGGAVIIPVFCNGSNWTNH
jgi:hypothetical protein